MRFEDDLSAFLNFIGRHVPASAMTERQSPIQKVADTDYLRGSKEKIVQAFVNLKRSDPKEAEKVDMICP